MPITNRESNTSVHEIAEGIFRISTPVSIPGAEFSFNQFLIVDEQPLLFHTGPRKLFSLVAQAVESVIPAKTLRFVGFSHFEADECGSLNEWLALAPQAVPLCGALAAMISVDDVADRPARALKDAELLTLGRHSVRWLDAPHLPHGWECGYLMELSTRTLLCGDLFTQPGAALAPITESDILAPSEQFRRQWEYFSHTPNSAQLLERLALEKPGTLACMHGSSWQGDGAALLRALGKSLLS
jgi:flavorubredoxin